MSPRRRPAPVPPIRVVTDSTASLPAHLLGSVDVVPLSVALGGSGGLEGVDVTADVVADALASGRRVTTSQPTRAAFEDAYERAAREGASGVVSVHLSGELSGTVRQAAAAAATASLPVRVVDSHTAAMALGFAALEAARVAADGGSGEAVARRAQAVARSGRAIFMVDSLDHLRRGGRLGAPAAALGTVLGVRPLLELRSGRVEVVQRVRTRAAAVRRLVDVALDSAGRRARPALCVHHVGAEPLAYDVAQQLEELSGVDVVVSPVSAVLGAHTGPGTLAIVVADLAAER